MLRTGFSSINSLNILVLILTTVGTIADDAGETLKFIDTTQTKLKLTDQSNVILLIGNTGSGKSTLAHYVAGDFSRLIAIEPNEDELDYSIYDGLDPDNGRATSTTVSRTLVPEMVIDESNNVWYDCPGFGDTRNTTVEIATTFLIKKVIENAKSVKIVLVVNEGAVRKGYDRLDLDKLITHTTHLVRDIDKYADSISMVVTKVQPYKSHGRNYIELHESNVRKATANYLTEYRNVLEEKGFSADKIQLIDALTKDGELKRIAIFWRPADAGPFNTIQKMVNGRRLVRETVLQQTVYTDIGDDDFGYPLTDAAQLRISEMVNFAVSDFYRDLDEMDKSFLKLLQTELKLTRDLFERESWLVNAKREIERVREASAHLIVNDLVNRVHDLAINLNISFEADGLHRMIQIERNVEILKSLARFEINDPVDDYVSKTLIHTANHITREHAWIELLVAVYNTFTTYEVQRDVRDYVRQLKPILDETSIPSTQQHYLHIAKNNFSKFARQFSDNEIADVTESELKELNEIIAFTINSELKVECINGGLHVMGNFVKSSNIRMNQCRSKVSRIVILVVDTFFVDSDLRADADLTILAAKWNIKDHVTFDLKGGDGIATEKPYWPGAPGHPGNAGANGKNFFGLANEIINGDFLTVVTSGGRGGRGQDGSSAEDTKVTVWETYHQGHIGFTEYVRDYYENYFNNFNQYVRSSKTYSNTLRYFVLLWGGTRKWNAYEIFPYNCCGRNGRGGSGGIGGHAGQHKFIAMNGMREIPKFVAVDGEIGPFGHDAAPCDSSGALVNVYTNDDVVPIYGIKLDSRFDVTSDLTNSDCPPEFVASSQQPTPPSASIQSLQITSSLTKYKSVLRQQMSLWPHIKSIQTAYHSIDLNAELIENGTVKDLIDDANALEEQFHGFNENIDLLPIYIGLLRKIEAFDDKRISSTSERHALALLNAHTLSQIIALENARNPGLNIHIEEFFNVTVNDIIDLEESGFVQALAKYQFDQKVAIDATVYETINFIENGIGMEIENCSLHLDFEIRQIVESIVTVQTRTVAERKMNGRKLKMLRENVLLSVLANLLNSVRLFIGDFGSASALLVGDATLDVRTDISPSMDEGSFEIIKAKLFAIETALNVLSTRLTVNDTPQNEQIGIELKSLVSIAQKLKSEERSVVMYARVNALLRDFEGFVDRHVEHFKGSEFSAHESFHNASIALNVIDSLPLLYLDCSDNDGKIEILSAAIDSNQKLLRQLSKFERSLYGDLLPALNNLKGKLNASPVADLSQESSPETHIRNFKIQRKLRAVRKQLSGLQLVDNSLIKENLKKIRESISLVISIYDRIQNYEDQSKLIAHLIGLQSIDFSNITEDAEWNPALRGLKLSLDASLVFTQYNRAVGAFNQAVFPFAADYTYIHRLPASVLAQNDTRTIVATALVNIKSLSGRIAEFEATNNSEDASAHYAHFGGSNPFYKWSNSDIQKQIHRLFDGQRIYLLADVTKTELNAVKFNRVGLEFVVDDASAASKLSNVLTAFRVTMTHMGGSHYRCGDQFYTINSVPQSISYSFRNQSDLTTTEDDVYGKPNTDIALLSPYALWSFQLFDGPFEQLAPFAELVDVELRGYGKFVSDNVTVYETDLFQHYSPL